ncbi:chorismate-binding protein, partial [Desulfovibrio desulfuricans]|nr:chorismate-binding protein [Desulfovibrio desulfuricans]
GTRPRGNSVQEDEAAAQSLRNDPKENAEHAMLVDLGRNDIGKVAAIGSVRVENMKQVQLYSHVMHMTSEVHGRLKKEYDMYDALASVLPAGTLSGAPK